VVRGGYVGGWLASFQGTCALIMMTMEHGDCYNILL
jgi:hypothetical protein